MGHIFWKKQFYYMEELSLYQSCQHLFSLQLLCSWYQRQTSLWHSLLRWTCPVAFHFQEMFSALQVHRTGQPPMLPKTIEGLSSCQSKDSRWGNEDKDAFHIGIHYKIAQKDNCIYYITSIQTKEDSWMYCNLFWSFSLSTLWELWNILSSQSVLSSLKENTCMLHIHVHP